MRKMLFFSILIALMLISSCAKVEESGKDLTDITVQLKFIHNPQFTGIYVAKERGFYEEEGLNVMINPAIPQDAMTEEVPKGNAQFGLANAYQLFKAKSDGWPVVAFASTYQRTPLGFMTLKSSNIIKPKDLLGKKISNVASGKQLFRAMYNRLDLNIDDVEELSYIEFDMEHLLRGDVDASIAWMAYHPYFPEVKGVEINKIIFADYGVSIYEDMIFTTEDMVKDNPELVERFLRASLKGWQWAIENPQEAGEISFKSNPKFPTAFHVYAIEHSIPFINPGDKPIGWIDRQRMERMYEEGLTVNAFENEFDVNTVFTTDFLKKIYRDS